MLVNGEYTCSTWTAYDFNTELAKLTNDYRKSQINDSVISLTWHIITMKFQSIHHRKGIHNTLIV